ncbi:hypothetical protein JVU11DRAFT_10826 [Chiua virens]|nr:hypothetical protein JVU11DRAFT_10826 [Chiua virens]
MSLSFSKHIIGLRLHPIGGVGARVEPERVAADRVQQGALYSLTGFRRAKVLLRWSSFSPHPRNTS